MTSKILYPQKLISKKMLKAKYYITSKINWWLIYGPPRCGTSYMLNLVSTCSHLYVGDWDLGYIIRPIIIRLKKIMQPNYCYIDFSNQQLLKDIAENIFDNASPGKGYRLDLVFKQAALDYNYYQGLKKMLGKPQRKIFCFRNPYEYIQSALIKFPNSTLNNLQETYLKSMNAFYEIRGDCFEYKDNLTLDDYLIFLKPLVFNNKKLSSFNYQKKYKKINENVDNRMLRIYRNIKKECQ